MVGVPEIEFGIYVCLSRSIKQVGNEQKRIAILLCNPIESMIVNAKAKTSILLFGEKDWSPMT
jgi:hypothetical protein